MKMSSYKTGKVGWVLDYNESKIQTNTASRIGGNIGGSRKAMERIFNHFAHQRESAGLKNRFIHLKLSLSPQDKTVSSAIFRKITEKLLHGLGLKNNPYVIYRHYDTDHPHLHIVISRVTFDGKLIRDSFDGLLMKKLERQLDVEFKLTASTSRLLTGKGVRLPQKWELQRSERNGLKSVRNYIQCGIIESLQGKPTLTLFVKRLERRGIVIWHREIQRQAKIYHGVSYSLDPTLLKTIFKDKSPSLAGGIDISLLDTLSNKKPVRINHPYFGSVIGKIITNLRGIPEFCMNLWRPDENMKPYSFRAANLGPYFQFASIMNELSQIDADTLERITLRVTKPTAKEYVREPLISAEKAITKLLVAAEMQSAARVSEALKDGIKLSDLQQFDRVCTARELDYIKMVMDATFNPSQQLTASNNTPTLSQFSQLVLQYRKIFGRSPDTPTITAIGMIAEKNWPQLQVMLNSVSKNNERQHAPDPSIMYLGMPTALSFTMMEYQHWYASPPMEMTADESSALRKQKQKDTEALTQALNQFDSALAKDILLTRLPDLSRISLEQLGVATDPEVVNLIKTLTGFIDDQRNEIKEKRIYLTEHLSQQPKEQGINKEKGMELG